MKTKQILLNIAMFIGGGVCGFFLADKLIAHKWARVANEEIESVKEAFGRQLDAIYQANDIKTEYSDHPEDNDGEPVDAVTEEEVDKIFTKQGTRTRTAYHEATKSAIDLSNVNLFKQDTRVPAPVRHNVFDDRLAHAEAVSEAAGQVTDDEDAITNAYDDSTTRDMTDVDRELPYLITPDQFSDEFPHHDKLELYYYTGDDVVADEFGDIIDDIDETIGWDVFDQLEMQTTSWVRNEMIQTDYEVYRVRGSYCEEVLGAKPGKATSPREQYRLRSKSMGEPPEDE